MTDNTKNTKNEQTLTELAAAYYQAAHAMQSGVAMKMNYENEDTMPKHLRVGVNSAMVSSSALAELLISKGIITEEEWWQSQVKFMENEVQIYKDWFAEKWPNININLR